MPPVTTPTAAALHAIGLFSEEPASVYTCEAGSCTYCNRPHSHLTVRIKVLRVFYVNSCERADEEPFKFKCELNEKEADLSLVFVTSQAVHLWNVFFPHTFVYILHLFHSLHFSKCLICCAFYWLSTLAFSMCLRLHSSTYRIYAVELTIKTLNLVTWDLKENREICEIFTICVTFFLPDGMCS